jgi:hypothetical protein
MRYFVIILIVFASRLLAFDHSYVAYDSLLKTFVSDGRVDYAGLRDNPLPLDSFLTECERLTFDEYQEFTRPEKMAFVINLYNAAVLELVLSHFPLESVRDIGGMFTSPWNESFVKLFGHSVSLGQIEHDLLRGEFKDPRIHFAISQAAKGSPMLLSAPYLPQTLDTQLDIAASLFLTDRPDANRLDQGTLYLSPIFDWYSADFGGRDAVKAFVRKFFPSIPQQFEIEYTHFDWSLNSR